MTASCHSLDIETYCELLTDEIARTATALGAVPPDTEVPSCPGWTIADLAEHIGGVHRWCEEMVRETAAARANRAPVAPSPEVRAAWVGDFAGRLTETFAAADPDAAMWSWGSDPHVRFWPRRMLHETTVHRADAEIAAGVAPAIDRLVAFDGVDEFLDNLPHAAYFAPNVGELRGDGDSLAFESDGARWLITLHADRFEWRHDDVAPARAAVRAAPGDLLLFVYGRRAPVDRVETFGDERLLTRWIENSRI